MTPTNLGAPIYMTFMISIFCCGDRAEGELGRTHWNSRAGKEVRDWLVSEKLIHHHRTSVADNGDVHMHYKATSRGRAWVAHACSTPLPIADARWVRGEDVLSASCTRAR